MAGKKQSALSPMMEQYFNIKSKYPDMLLFFRLGDFYEMFFEDAKTASCAACRFTRRTAISQSS